MSDGEVRPLYGRVCKLLVKRAKNLDDQRIGLRRLIAAAKSEKPEENFPDFSEADMAPVLHLVEHESLYLASYDDEIQQMWAAHRVLVKLEAEAALENPVTS